MTLAVFLYDLTGTMAQPWLEAGYTCLIVDTQHPEGLTGTGAQPANASGRLWRLNVDLRNPFVLPKQFANERIAFVAAFPPCDHLSVSGSRWFKGKGLRLLSLSVDLFATAAEFCEASGAPYLIENPVSMMSTYWRKPDYIFAPYEFTAIEPRDNYKKRTCLWTGNGFVMPLEQRDLTLGEPDERIHRASPGKNKKDRANFRSATPMGFARATFDCNRDLFAEAA